MDRPILAVVVGPDLRALLDASPSAVVAVGPDGRIVYANQRVEATFGHAPDEVLGTHVETLMPPRAAASHVRHRTGFMAHPSARPMGIGLDLAGRHRDGREFPVEISLAPLDTPGGRLVFATVVDITARKSLEAQLLQAQKMESVGRLAGGIAHDFNNMLFAIRAYADILAEDVVLESPKRDPQSLLASIEGIRRAAEQAAALTSQLLAFSRKQMVQPVVLDVRAAVGHIEPMLRRLIGEDVRLSLALSPDTGKAKLDPTQLDQVLVNLVVNARDAMPDGGTITIESANVVLDEPYALEHFEVTPGSYVVLVVTDTGSGMDRETRARVFEPFFTTKPVGQGTGLGLATVYGIVRQAGGHVWVYSEVGLGSTFKVYFPRVEVGAEAARRDPADAVPVRLGHILLVEDEPAVREAARTILERAGYSVRATGDPREALPLVEEGTARIDVLVTDIVMPGLSGRELAARALAARPDLGIVLLSGYTEETTDVAALVERGARFGSKPLSPRDLVALVQSVMPGGPRTPTGA